MSNIIMNEESYMKLKQKLKSKRLTFIVKRIFDILLSLILILILSPILVLISICIYLSMGSPVIFKQERMGKNNRKFLIWKFRTMKIDTETRDGITLKEDKRITKIGKFLRKFRLDELPQLLNILKGEMSFVGPRPDLPHYYDNNDYGYKAVLLVRPGVTGIATLEYKDEDILLNKSDNPEETYVNIVFPDKVKLNIEYINNISFFNDIKLILKTVLEVFIR